MAKYISSSSLCSSRKSSKIFLIPRLFIFLGLPSEEEENDDALSLSLSPLFPKPLDDDIADAFDLRLLIFALRMKVYFLMNADPIVDFF